MLSLRNLPSFPASHNERRRLLCVRYSPCLAAQPTRPMSACCLEPRLWDFFLAVGENGGGPVIRCKLPACKSSSLTHSLIRPLHPVPVPLSLTHSGTHLTYFTAHSTRRECPNIQPPGSSLSTPRL
ncbi:hypothetical protein LZ30DRAFT_703940 [Colletotrichum cereale]|nr:hypothetical protein LZ30DRAFT_703940 [Colletotrichum cereale]